MSVVRLIVVYDGVRWSSEAKDVVDCERDLGWCGKGFCPRMLRRSCVSWYAVRDGKVARMRLGPSVEGLGRGWGL